MIKSIIVKKRFILLILSIIYINLSVFSQVNIKKSNEVRIVNGKEYYIHIVEKGHTLYSLARVYEILIDEIVFENPAAKDQLLIGQELKIPVKSRDEAVVQSLNEEADEFFYHVAKNGESLQSIARIYLINKKDLEKANPSLSDPLKTGQYIKVPVGAKTSAPNADQIKIKEETIHPTVVENQVVKQQKTQSQGGEHIVKAGENLYRIALNYQLSIEEIKAANPGLTEILSVGQRITIPLKKKESDFIIHKVKRKSKLIRVARNYNIDVRVLRDLNPGIREKLKSGDVIRIPLNWEPEIIEEIIAVEEKETVVEETETQLILNQDSLQCAGFVVNLQDTFKIALMIPLYLEEVDSLKFTKETDVDDLLNERPFRFLQFYYGAMMAVDSLNALGMHTELSVYDVDNSIGKTIQVLQDSSLQEQDLIIGPFHRRSFKLTSHFAKIFEIPIINPLTESTEVIEDNPFSFKCEPNPDSQHKQVRNLVATYFRDAKIFFVKHKQALEEKEFPLYFAEIEDLLDTGYYVSNDIIYDLIIEKSIADTTTIYESVIDTMLIDSLSYYTTEFDSLIIEDELLRSISIEGTQILTDSIEFNLYDSTYIINSVSPFYYSIDSLHAFENQASIYRDNVVFVFTDDNVFALDLMTKLNIARDTFSTTIVGLPDWEGFNNMDYEILSNLKVHFLSASFVNYQDRDINRFIYDFRNQYLTEPLYYAFKGFDISWYFLNAMMSYGKDFMNCLPYYSPSNIQSEMKFERANEGDGFENQIWKILKYDRLRLREVITHPPDPPEEPEQQDV